jgi:hypothetical protein
MSALALRAAMEAVWRERHIAFPCHGARWCEADLRTGALAFWELGTVVVLVASRGRLWQRRTPAQSWRVWWRRVWGR